MEFKHTSVLLHETIDNLNIRPDGIYVDGTLGGAGHSSEIVKRLNENGRLIGIDQDEDAIAAASERLKDYSDKVTIIRSNYCNMKEELNRIGVTKVNGILLDLGSIFLSVRYTGAWIYLPGRRCTTGHENGSASDINGKRYCK